MNFDYVKTKEQFIEEVFEIAFGENAINRDFGYNEVLETLMEFSDNALKIEELSMDIEEYEKMDEQLENSYRKGYADGKKYEDMQQYPNNEYYSPDLESKF
tara:strand:- start:1540 stop:1842 length:303 start_codon:yes stop_codon:yes gene_type:complete